jgi:hypothetical protein
MPVPEEGQRQPADDLIGLQGDGNEGMDLAEQARSEHRRQQAQPRVAGGNGH